MYSSTIAASIGTGMALSFDSRDGSLAAASARSIWARENPFNCPSAVGASRSLANACIALGAPARDLHTGDAQEYLLFLVGLAVLALLLPLLQ